MKIRRNLGFEGRVFLTKWEWETYCRRKPVRYIKKRKDRLCFYCQKPEEINNKFENSHIIGFDLGIIELGLIPDYLDSDNNIVTAHRIKCNASCQIGMSDAMRLLLKTTEFLPEYLPEYIQLEWNKIKSQSNPVYDHQT